MSVTRPSVRRTGLSRAAPVRALPAASVLAVAVCAVMAGASTFAAIADWVDDLDAALAENLVRTGHAACS
ncbi:hypothetical protein AB0C02_27335 [Micromonospora sp. NPDC048999]|uniref:hypothetical protein n=1 Tax=Micromonospora sp. NPDC048999 TaxID=3155391 RepID=UPI0033F90BEC